MPDTITPGTIPTGDWESDIQTFRSEPSVKNYLALRRSYPNEVPPVQRYSGIDELYALRPLLEKFSIEPEDLAACMDADPEAIDRVSLKLLSLLQERRELEAKGGNTLQSRGVAIADSLINYLIFIVLECMEQYNEPVLGSAFFMLIKEQLGGQNMGLHKVIRKKNRKAYVVAVIASSRSLGMQCSLGQVAQILGVNKSSLSRMFEKGELEQLIEEEMQKPALDGLTPFEEEDLLMKAMPRHVRNEIDLG